MARRIILWLLAGHDHDRIKYIGERRKEYGFWQIMTASLIAYFSKDALLESWKIKVNRHCHDAH
jgi:hypothetical protein